MAGGLFECEMSRSVLFSYRGSHEVRCTFDFALGMEPVFELFAGEAAALQIDFVSATTDVGAIW